MALNEAKSAGKEAVFLKKIAEARADTLVGGVVRAFSDGVHAFCLARVCRDMEEEIGMTTLNLTGSQWQDT